MHLSGRVSSGLGRAHVFMAQPHYQEQFKQVLEVSAWPGTLNLDMDKFYPTSKCYVLNFFIYIRPTTDWQMS